VAEFVPGPQWRGRRQSTNVEDRRGQPAPRVQPPGYSEPEAVPPWFDDLPMRMRAQGNYETGDRDTDDFLRRSKMEQYDPNSWTAESYKNPARARDMLSQFYKMGRYGDQDALKQLQRYQNDPFGRLLMRAYREGGSRRQPQTAQRFGGRGIGMAVAE